MTEIVLTQELVRELFSCDPETGILIWRKPLRHRYSRACDWSRACNAKTGKPAGVAEKKKYNRRAGSYSRLKLQISFDGRMLNTRVHRVVWIYFNGEIPEGSQIDHINRDSTDNRLCNLRLATARQNIANGAAHRVNGSHPYIGVYVDKKHGGRFKARARGLDGRDNHVIYSTSPETAAMARDLIASLWNREFAKLNFPDVEALTTEEKISEFLRLGGNPRLVSNTLP